MAKAPDASDSHDRSGGEPEAADADRLDAHTVAELYREHAAELRRFLAGVLGDGQLAADAMQAAFVKAIELGGGSRAESRKAWLFRVAFHEALVLRRRDDAGQRAMQRLADVVRASAGATMDTAEEIVQRREAVEALREAIARLSDEQQQIVRMRIHEDKTFAQIAADLGIPLGTALTRMRSALARLKAALAGKSADDRPMQ